MVSDIQVARKYLTLLDRSITKKVPFDLTLMGLKNVMSAKRCYYTGREFTPQDGLTIDRVDPNKGYATGNIVACCHTVNQAKDNISPELIIQIADALRKRAK